MLKYVLTSGKGEIFVYYLCTYFLMQHYFYVTFYIISIIVLLLFYYFILYNYYFSCFCHLLYSHFSFLKNFNRNKVYITMSMIMFTWAKYLQSKTTKANARLILAN